MPKQPNQPGDGSEEGAEATRQMPLKVPSADGVQTIVDRRPAPAPLTETQGESRPFSLSPDSEIDDERFRDFVDHTLQPEGERMMSFGEFARGGMGAIERIVDRVLQRQAAAKVMRADYRSDERLARDFVREAQITGQLDHPNIVPIYDLGTTADGRLCFTMKLVEGHTLSNLIERLPAGAIERGQLLDLIDVVLRVCDALAFAHNRGVVHCDVKPGNVMVADFGQVYLMDWGIAQLIDVDADAGVRLVTCTVAPGDKERLLGTPSFMAPEQAFGQAVDHRTDVFAVGTLLYAILCRRPPFASRDSSAALRAARRCDFSRPIDVAEGVSPELNRIVVKAMDLHPGRRYGSVIELKQDLVRFTRGGGDFPRVEHAAGTTIVREGEVGDAAYIIERGRCDVFKSFDGRQTKVREMGPGEVFGETAIFAASPRTATVIAADDCVLLEVTREVLEHELGAMKPWMSSFIRTLAKRFREREASG